MPEAAYSALRGVVAPLPTPLLENSHYDAASHERLLTWVLADGLGVHGVYSAPGHSEGNLLPPDLAMAANETCHLALKGSHRARHWAGLSAATEGELLSNLEGALGRAYSAVIVDPMATQGVLDPVEFFLRRWSPVMERSGRKLPLILEDSGMGERLRVRDLKRLARLDYLVGLKLSAAPSVFSDYIKAARHYKTREQFGIYLGNAGLIFQLFKPSQGPLASVRERLRRVFEGAEPPHGVCPLSANLFPRAWRKAWEAAQAGDAGRMAAYEAAFAEVQESWTFQRESHSSRRGMACVKAALVEEGVIASDTPVLGASRLEGADRAAWLKAYGRLKLRFEKLMGSEPALAPAQAFTSASATDDRDQVESFDIVGCGGAVLDEFFRVDQILPADAKGLIRQEPTRRPGGVVLNHLCWARALGAKTALFGPAGLDAEADFLREAMRRRGVDDRHFTASRSRTVRARIFVDAKGERSIYMQPGITQEVKPKDLEVYAPLIARARLLSTEISQLSLAAVLKLQAMAQKAKVPNVVDLDIPPKQASGPGGLGSPAELAKVLLQADYLKTNFAWAQQLVKGKGPALAKSLHAKLKKKPGYWVCISDGSKGCYLSDGKQAVSVAGVKGIKVIDATGSGDALLGALMAGTLLKLGLRDLGALGNAAGALCATQVGAVPPDMGAQKLILKYYKGQKLKLGPEPAPREEALGGDAGAFMRRSLSELSRLSLRFPGGYFDEAKAMIRQAESQGKRLHITGVGKPEYVARYIASSFSSTGTPAFFLHATEAGHGASGQVASGDVVIGISNSGETEELKSAVATVKANGAKIIAVSGRAQSWLVRQSDAYLFAGVDHEGDALNLAPRASILAEILVLSALGVELQHDKEFTAVDFRSFHPGGSLGKKKL